MIQNIGVTDEALSGYTLRILKYLEGEVRLKCSNTRRGRQTVELLYAYRLNFTVGRDLDLSEINRQQPYPLPPLDPEKPETSNASVVYSIQQPLHSRKGATLKLQLCHLMRLVNFCQKELLEQLVESSVLK